MWHLACTGKSQILNAERNYVVTGRVEYSLIWELERLRSRHRKRERQGDGVCITEEGEETEGKWFTNHIVQSKGVSTSECRNEQMLSNVFVMVSWLGLIENEYFHKREMELTRFDLISVIWERKHMTGETRHFAFVTTDSFHGSLKQLYGPI